MKWLPWLDFCVKLLAVAIGGWWVLFNYVRGRTHKSRLRLRVFAERAFLDAQEYLIITTELTNVGLSRVFVSTGCHATVYADELLPRKLGIVMPPKWEELKSITLYEGQKWIEPNGLLNDQKLVAVPALADRFLKVWVHFESPAVGLNAYVVVAPKSATTGSMTRTTEEDKIVPHY